MELRSQSQSNNLPVSELDSQLASQLICESVNWSIGQLSIYICTVQLFS